MTLKINPFAHLPSTSELNFVLVRNQLRGQWHGRKKVGTKRRDPANSSTYIHQSDAYLRPAEHFDGPRHVDRLVIHDGLLSSLVLGLRGIRLDTKDNAQGSNPTPSPETGSVLGGLILPGMGDEVAVNSWRNRGARGNPCIRYIRPDAAWSSSEDFLDSHCNVRQVQSGVAK